MIEAWLTTRVHVVAKTDDKRFVSLGVHSVSPPCARVAIGCEELLASDTVESMKALGEVIREWLPLRLWSRLVSKEADHAVMKQVVKALLLVGVQNIEKFRDDEQHVKQKARRLGWSHLVAEYRSLLNGSLDEPWGFFVGQLREMDRIRAQNELSQWLATGGAFTGSKSALRRVQERAGVDTNALDRLNDEELRRRQKESLRNIKGEYRAMQRKHGRA